jgi:ferredoxin
MARLTIDGIEVDVAPGATVLEAAETAGVKIPTLCHHRSLAPYGACRVCLVEVEAGGRSKIEASCIYPAQDGLVVGTDTERVRRTRGVMVELLLARSPEAHAVKQLAADLGIEDSRFPKRHEDCILCGLCVRVCQERMGIGAVSFAKRGPDREIATPFDKHSPICIACGACQVVCPVNVVDLSTVTRREPRPILSDYDMGLAQRSSIYVPFPQAIPKVATIDVPGLYQLLRGQCNRLHSAGRDPRNRGRCRHPGAGLRAVRSQSQEGARLRPVSQRRIESSVRAHPLGKRTLSGKRSPAI